MDATPDQACSAMAGAVLNLLVGVSTYHMASV